MQSTISPIRIMTMCIGRICIGYRTTHRAHHAATDFFAIASIFLAAFVAVWILIVILLMLFEVLRPSPLLPTDMFSGDPHIRQHIQRQEREQLVKEMLKCHADLDEDCPLDVQAENSPEETCAVCLDEMQSGSIRRRLPCNHSFHVSYVPVAD